MIGRSDSRITGLAASFLICLGLMRDVASPVSPEDAYRSYFEARVNLASEVSLGSKCFELLLEDPPGLTPEPVAQDEWDWVGQWNANAEGRLASVQLEWESAYVAVVRARTEPPKGNFAAHSAPRIAVLLRKPQPSPGNSVGGIRNVGDPIVSRDASSRWQVALDVPASRDEQMTLSEERLALSDASIGQLNTACRSTVSTWLSSLPNASPDSERLFEEPLKSTVVSSSPSGALMLTEFIESEGRRGTGVRSLRERFLLITFRKSDGGWTAATVRSLN